MSRYKNTLLLALIALFNIYLAFSQPSEPVVSINPVPSLSPAEVKPVISSLFSTNLLSSFPEDLEISGYCKELLLLFAQRYVAFVGCLIPAARPVKVCQTCFSSHLQFQSIYNNISSNEAGPGNESCRDNLLRKDRLMLVYQLYSNLDDLWNSSNCHYCINERDQSVTNDTLNFITALNQTLTCFEKYQLGNHTELCKSCKQTYRGVNELYGRMEKNSTICIDIEDAMNMTRRLWSKNFGCSLPRDEMVPVIAVSSFMLFLPIIFYLSSFLHSEQKKRKLIHPNRAKSYATLMNIQDKQS